ncbi:hypothetical protein RRG08_031359 [Elysia crispata]|uniref:Uncharacterized protein n=1 Tax=Elysia crispata TaxID=231223 RepID=A0AAE0YK23_9GAST|nr:hypothetical protein RRG08_031359 [Elysia crispata]
MNISYQYRSSLTRLICSTLYSITSQQLDRRVYLINSQHCKSNSRVSILAVARARKLTVFAGLVSGSGRLKQMLFTREKLFSEIVLSSTGHGLDLDLASKSVGWGWDSNLPERGLSVRAEPHGPLYPDRSQHPHTPCAWPGGQPSLPGPCPQHVRTHSWTCLSLIGWRPAGWTGP